MADRAGGNRLQLLSVREAAERLGVSEKTVRREIDAGEIEASRIGPKRGVIRISEEDLRRYIRRRAL